MPSIDFKSIDRKYKNSLVKFARQKGIRIHVTNRKSVYDVTIMCNTETLGATGF